ncbi:MAG: strawberry notch family protein [Rhodobacteraceae bacterium]|nr:strawberry notch family protein [Paracoccaceae bacterium]
MKDVMAVRVGAVRGAMAAAIRTEGLAAAKISEIMSESFGGSDAAGAWDWRQAYDLMQAAAIDVLAEAAGSRSLDRILDAAIDLAASLPTETRRSERQMLLQQFSTALPWAVVMAFAGGLRETDVVLEPSAGTGSLIRTARLSERKLRGRAVPRVHANEIDPFRGAILRDVLSPGASITSHDAEFIDDLLGADVHPDLILMNPPFASSVARGDDPTLALRHAISAAKRLAPGGRLVAILPPYASGERQADLWRRFTGIVQPLARLVLPRSAFSKIGTSIETHLLVAEKRLPGTDRPRADFSDRMVVSPAQAMALLADGLPDRMTCSDTRSLPVAARKPASISRPAAPPAKPDPKAPGMLLPRRLPLKGGRTAAATPATPLCVTALDTPRVNEAISGVYARYRPQRLMVEGAQPHPTTLVESLAMASVAPPVPDLSSAPVSLPQALLADGRLSEAQVETILMAETTFAQDLPGRFTFDEQGRLVRADSDPNARAFRRGYFLGDGTGCGKGRQVAGLILAGWIAGRRKALWISRSATLVEDAIRDWTDLGGAPTDIAPLSRWTSDEPIPMSQGILFTTYATLRAVAQSGRTRLAQILDWLGEAFDGVVAFDEAHAMQNAGGGETERGATAPSQQGLAGLRLQHGLPRARIFYVSATGATQVANLAYAGRLGLWGAGPDYAFPSREAFVEAMEAGGVAAMEVVARDLKALGLYTARALSFEGVEYDVLEHELSPDQITIYDTWAKAFAIIHTNLRAALEATGITAPEGQGETGAGSAKAAAISAFESTKQRFFGHLLLGLKMPTVLEAIRRDLEEGWAPVVQIVSTGEAILARRIETLAPDEELTEAMLTPREYVVGYLMHAFPVHQMQLVEQEDGSTLAIPLSDANGAPVLSREAVALRDRLIEDLMLLAPIPSALDQLLWTFGPERVAEVTGRSQRPLRDRDGRLRIERRAGSANSAESTAFLEGTKNVLVFSDAGGTGRSYHAAISAQNQKRRRHYLLEPGWRADNAIQGLGRTHRSAQVSAPFFRVCTTNVHGEKRFTSTIARRLDTLGALTKGQRETASQGMFRAEDNLESPIARACLRALYRDIACGHEAPISLEAFTDWTGLRLLNDDGQLLEELPPIQRFLNRILALPIAMQNGIFATFMERIATATERALAAGTLDQGLETLRGDRITAGSPERLRTCPKTGAETSLIPLSIETRLSYRSADQVTRAYPASKPMQNASSGKVALIAERPRHAIDDVGQLLLERRVTRPMGESWIGEDEFERSQWERIDPERFAMLWDAEVASLPDTDTQTFYLLTGLILPIWRTIPGNSLRIYRAVCEDGTSLLGRAVSPADAAILRGRFMSVDQSDPASLLCAVVDGARSVELIPGLTLARRRVAGKDRLEITGADRPTLDWLRSLGCFTEIHQFALRVFVPFGDGVDSLAVLQRIIAKQHAMAA